jgi:hypothetical protein
MHYSVSFNSFKRSCILIDKAAIKTLAARARLWASFGVPPGSGDCGTGADDGVNDTRLYRFRRLLGLGSSLAGVVHLSPVAEGDTTLRIRFDRRRAIVNGVGDGETEGDD